MIRIAGITYDNEIETEIPIDGLDFTRYKWYWVDFNEPSEKDIDHLTDTFRFHPLAVEDCLHTPQRPKLDYYEDYTFFVTHVVKEEEKEIIREELNFFISDYYIVTYHRESVLEANQVWERLMYHNNTEKWDPYYVFYDILDKIVDNYFPLMYKIEDELDKIENNTQNHSMEQLLNVLFDTRHMLLNLRHSINPMRDLLYRMLNSHHLQGIRERWEYFSDIYDHLLKLSDMAMSSRELTADIRDSYLSLNSHQTNNVMRVLTIITSIFAPLTFIAGIYGMNFQHMPELAWKYGYFLSLALMGAVGVVLYLWFKKKGWF